MNGGLTIAQLSDLHCGAPHFVPSLLDRAIVEVNELEPDVVVVSGDLTGDGFRGEYELAREYLDKVDCGRMLVIPGNHDSRNVGYVHFEELFGERRSELHVDGISIVAVDSTEPDLDHGVIGRGRYGWIEERFGANEAFLVDTLAFGSAWSTCTRTRPNASGSARATRSGWSSSSGPS